MIGDAAKFSSAGRTHWGWIIGIMILLLLLPAVFDTNTPTLLGIWALFALSLGLMWGYAGILSFGHAAYFGLGAYTYALSVINMGESTMPVLLAIALPGLFALLLGYFMFYGRLSDVYMGVITLTVSLILFNSVNSTAGPEWRIGNAPLGGFNGIPSIPSINYPGNPEDILDPLAFFYLSAFSLIAIYGGLRWLISSRIGHVIVAIKENEQRGRLARMIENVHASLLGVTCRDALPDEHFSWLARQRA